MSSPTSSPEFEFHVRLGLVFIVEASCVSAIAVLLLLLYLAYNAYKSQALPSSPGGSQKLAVQRHIRIYFISMLCSELAQAAGGIVSIKWISESSVSDGAACTAQSILEEVGDVGVALATLAIAIQTFSIIVLHWQPPMSLKIPTLVVTGIWVFIALIIGVSAATHKGKDYWGDTGYWCWITAAYPKQRILLEYLWMWLAALLNFVLYIPIALTLRGNLHINGWKIHLGRKDGQRMLIQGKRESDAIATKMLFYPLIYTLTVLPIAIARWLAFSGGSVTFAATIFSDILFCCSGVFNVLLFTITRPALLRVEEKIPVHIHSLPQVSYPAHNGARSDLHGRTQSSFTKSDRDAFELDLFKQEGYQFDPFPSVKLHSPRSHDY